VDERKLDSRVRCARRRPLLRSGHRRASVASDSAAQAGGGPRRVRRGSSHRDARRQRAERPRLGWTPHRLRGGLFAILRRAEGAPGVWSTIAFGACIATATTISLLIAVMLTRVRSARAARIRPCGSEVRAVRRPRRSSLRRASRRRSPRPFSVYVSPSPAMRSSIDGSTDCRAVAASAAARKYTVEAIGQEGTWYRCSCGDRYLLIADHFNAVGPDGELQPFRRHHGRARLRRSSTGHFCGSCTCWWPWRSGNVCSED